MAYSEYAGFQIRGPYEGPVAWTMENRCFYSGLILLLDVATASHAPGGFTYPTLKDSGPKSHTISGFWNQSP